MATFLYLLGPGLSILGLLLSLRGAWRVAKDDLRFDAAWLRYEGTHRPEELRRAIAQQPPLARRYLRFGIRHGGDLPMTETIDKVVMVRFPYVAHSVTLVILDASFQVLGVVVTLVAGCR